MTDDPIFNDDEFMRQIDESIMELCNFEVEIPPIEETMSLLDEMLFVDPLMENLPTSTSQAEPMPLPPPAPGVTCGKSAISIRLDGWLLQAFKIRAQSQGVGYQTLIQQELAQVAASWA